MKSCLSSAPILQFPDFNEKFILTTDASKKALSAVLSQGTPPDDSHAEWICSEISPILSTDVENCAINLLTKHHQSHNCDRRVTNITSEIWITLQSPNSWIAIFPNPSVLYVKCNDEPTEEFSVNGSGLITIHEDCQVKTDNLLIHPYKTYTGEVYSNIQPIIQYDLKFNETIQRIKNSLTEDIQEMRLSNVLSADSSELLQSLSNSIQELQQLRAKKRRAIIYQQMTHEVDYWTLSFFIFLLITSYVVFLIGLQFCKTAKRNYKIASATDTSLHEIEHETAV